MLIHYGNACLMEKFPECLINRKFGRDKYLAEQQRQASCIQYNVASLVLLTYQVN